MMRRYAIVLALAVFGVLVVSYLLRAPAVTRARALAPAPREALALQVDVYDDHLSTAPESLPLGDAVEFTVRNHTAVPLRLALAGYEDRVSVTALAPGAAWRGTFLADRPGEQFAWLVNGEAQGRLDIRGPHLVEGHR